MNVVGGGVPDAPRNERRREHPGGMNLSPTGGTLTGFDVKLRRGQDPSLRSNRYMGGNGKAAGRACPAPTGCHKWVANERGKGGRQPAPTVGGKFAAKDVGGGVPDAPRRGQDPSLRCKPLKGIQWQGCGPGMPGPYGLLFPASGVRGNARLKGGGRGGGVKNEK